MLASTMPTTATLYKYNINVLHRQIIFSGSTNVEFIVKPGRSNRRTVSLYQYNNYHINYNSSNFKGCSLRSVVATASNGDGTVDATSQQSSPPPDIKGVNSSSTIGDSYVALFVRMLGMDNDPLDREQAIVALWKYSLGGKKCVDAIMQFHGCINLTVSLLQSESIATCEAAAGLLRSVSSINLYRDSVAQSGAMEAIKGLLIRPSLTSEVKEQSICTLWNLSVDEKLRVKIANGDLLPLLINSLEDEDLRVKEAAGGVLANLALSHSNHEIMVEMGVVPKLAKLLKTDEEESKVIVKEARNALIELAKDEYYRILIIEEGLVPVPLIGAAAYKSFKPGLHSWPSLPDGTQIERTSQTPSRFGASELLLGLNVEDENVNIEEAKMNAMVGRTRQQFLARIGAIELEDSMKSVSGFSSERRITILPWVDGVARLVLILGLEDELAVSRAAESIGDACINEHMRESFKEAGAIKHLVRLLDRDNDAVRLNVAYALERLSISHGVCDNLDAEGVIHPLVNILKHSDACHISESLMEKALNILGRVLDPNKEMKSKFYDGPVNGSNKGSDTTISLDVSKNTAEVLASKTNICDREEVLDSAFIERLVNILKTSNPNLQRKVASILEFTTIIDPSMNAIISKDIESGLDAVFHQQVLADTESEDENQPQEKYALEFEEASLAISAASRLLTKLLESKQFCETINSTHFIKVLREILKSEIPPHNKDYIAACLIKLTSISSPNPGPENPINIEVTLYETIPRLIEQMKSSFSPESRESAVIELNRIISEGVVDSTRAVASNGGIFALVKAIEEGSDRAVEAGLGILYNLSMESENHSAILAAGAVPVLRRIVLSERPSWTRALRLLRNLPI